jgi:hypothetical protein
MDKKKICFVIMGYGVKTDYETGRELDLDKTYKNMIKPAVEEAGYECWRADEIKHSGIIDVPMYKYLLSADIVIADLSTSNSNAFYELGIRHALRPFTTIEIAENKLKYPFDVNHNVIRKYEHLGKDIGYSEVVRFRKELKDAIVSIANTSETDSPVYTYITNLKPPEWTDEIAARPQKSDTSLSDIIEQARYAMDNEDDVMKAKKLFEEARAIDNKDVYILQKLALTTYKSKQPTHVEALVEALNILRPLNAESSTDPETLGLCGAIYKRLWEETKEASYLNKSIYHYERGFYIKNDYYNGINLAFLLNIRGNLSVDSNDSITDFVLANRVRKHVVDICERLIASDFDSRSDQYWILATMEEALFALGISERYELIKGQAVKLSNAEWKRSSTEDQIAKLDKLLKTHH